VRELPALLDRLEEAGGPTDPVPSADGWELVLAENVAYLVDDQRRWQALAAASTRLPAEVPPRQRAYQLLRRHGQAVCRRKQPACASCVIAGDCPSAGHPPALY